jgi:hypothetical protein
MRKSDPEKGRLNAFYDEPLRRADWAPCLSSRQAHSSACTARLEVMAATFFFFPAVPVFRSPPDALLPAILLS